MVQVKCVIHENSAAGEFS